MKMERNVDISSRRKAFTAEIGVNHLPVNREQLEAALGFLGFVTKSRDTSVVIHINNKQYVNDVPLSILFAKSANGFYMELCYPMDDFGWDHPLLLAHDHLSEEDAACVLIAILDACTDNVPVIQKEFRDVTGWVYGDKEMGDISGK